MFKYSRLDDATLSIIDKLKLIYFALGSKRKKLFSKKEISYTIKLKGNLILINTIFKGINNFLILF